MENSSAKNLHDTPALGLRVRTSLLNEDLVARFGDLLAFRVLIVSGIFCVARDELFVAAVHLLTLHPMILEMAVKLLFGQTSMTQIQKQQLMGH